MLTCPQVPATKLFPSLPLPLPINCGIWSTCPACCLPPLMDQAIDPANKELANFELRETTAVLTVLKEMRTPTPPMDERTTVWRKVKEVIATDLVAGRGRPSSRLRVRC